MPPFGYMSQYEGSIVMPKRISVLSGSLAQGIDNGTSGTRNLQGGLVGTWGITDADAVSAASYASQVPAAPVHGAYRNTIFLDGHAESLSTTLMFMK